MEWTNAERIMNQTHESSEKLYKLLLNLTEWLPNNATAEDYKDIINSTVTILEELESELEKIGGLASEIDCEDLNKKIKNRE